MNPINLTGMTANNLTDMIYNLTNITNNQEQIITANNQIITLLIITIAIIITGIGIIYWIKIRKEETTKNKIKIRRKQKMNTNNETTKEETKTNEFSKKLKTTIEEDIKDIKKHPIKNLIIFITAITTYFLIMGCILYTASRGIQCTYNNQTYNYEAIQGLNKQYNQEVLQKPNETINKPNCKYNIKNMWNTEAYTKDTTNNTQPDWWHN